MFYLFKNDFVVVPVLNNSVYGNSLSQAILNILLYLVFAIKLNYISEKQQRSILNSYEQIRYDGPYQTVS